MILPLRLPHPSQTPSFPSYSAPWSSVPFFTVSAQVSSDLSTRGSSAASSYRLDNSEARRSVHLLIPSGACRLVIASTSASSQHFMAPSVRCSPDMACSNKRLCKALELSNGRSRVFASGNNQGFEPGFRVSAFTGHGQSELSASELEQSDGDGMQMHARCSGAKAGKMKSAKELHFEAIEAYCLNYEGEDIDCYEADAATSKDMHEFVLGHTPTLEGDAVNTPSFKIEKRSMPGKRSQSSTIGIVKVEGPKNLYINSGIAQRTDDPQDEGSVPNLMKRQTVRTLSLNSSQHRNKLDEEEVLRSEKCQCQNKLGEEEALQTGKCQSENKALKFKVENLNSEIGDLSEEQKIRMELNKAAALARRNMRSCEDAVAEAQAKGVPFPKFESLLVEKSWAEALGTEFQKPYMERLHQFVSQEAAGRIPIYPPPAKLFNAFNSCPLDKVKVVIIGQDPYHGPGQAMGLCFSVEQGIKIPSSLTNIFLEIQSDLDCDFPSHGNLEKWAHQGVLLLNTVLTVRDRHANSHAKKGWELFTDAAIRTLVQQRSGVVFLLWGNQAQEKLRLINKTSHHILKAFHPSGISAHRGFFKCRHFSKTNGLLVDEGLLPIDWQL